MYVNYDHVKDTLLHEGYKLGCSTIFTFQDNVRIAVQDWWYCSAALVSVIHSADDALIIKRLDCIKDAELDLSRADGMSFALIRGLLDRRSDGIVVLRSNFWTKVSRQDITSMLESSSRNPEFNAFVEKLLRPEKYTWLRNKDSGVVCYVADYVEDSVVLRSIITYLPDTVAEASKFYRFYEIECPAEYVKDVHDAYTQFSKNLVSEHNPATFVGEELGIRVTFAKGEYAIRVEFGDCSISRDSCVVGDTFEECWKRAFVAVPEYKDTPKLMEVF